MELPILLSGPIIRKVDPTQVYIWIATSKDFHIKAELYQVGTNQDSKDDKQLQVRTILKSIRLGKQLFIHLVHITPLEENLPVDQLLGYNLFFTKGSNKYDLSSLGLLSPNNPNSIVYGDFLYPTFYINSKPESAILYGSCRKLHGKGQDALARADEMIAKKPLDKEIRPSSLYMLGDQIYADDVADPIFPIIQEMSRQLTGHEQEDLSKVEPSLKRNNFKQRLTKIQGRQFIIEQFCKFTSSNAYNHLITFGEYATMYLLSWSPVLWQMAKEEHVMYTFEEAYQHNLIHFNSPKKAASLKEHHDEYLQYKDRYHEQSLDIEQFQQSVAKVRRLLANIPTYMIFDDHDITDDWNISLEWKKQVHEAPLGRHTIANGLAAYWAFQGWGNDPSRFDQSFISAMNQYFNGFHAEAPAYKNWLQTLEEFQSWHFTAPTTPLTLFLDTRTLREFDSTPKQVKWTNLIEETTKTPKLIGEKGWELVNQTLQDSDWNKGEPLIIASPAPLYGVGVIESFLKNNIYPFRVLGVPVHYKLDFEAWKYNVEGFSSFLHYLKEWMPSECIILSGDVHYASTVKADVEINNEQLSIYQLTSSPMKNMSFEGLFGSLLKLIVWITTLRQKEKTVNRYYDDKNPILKESDLTHQSANMVWKEKISYQSLEHGTIIETANNLGLLTRTNKTIQNVLLQDFNEQRGYGKFEPFPLK
ncbi:alkaline phosphatase D family protein [Metabacillus sp. FJAT-53654]|uniref:Alkaline phosphatase D family protein n=1 Tax=Metabacillus rhizosphaerae TaxID=3117747 RepID=A0ABZ2MW36_9BACI